MAKNLNATALSAAMGCDIAELREMARRVVSSEIRHHGGNLTRVAEALGVDRKTVHRWVTASSALRSAQLKHGGGRRGRPPQR